MSEKSLEEILLELNEHANKITGQDFSAPKIILVEPSHNFEASRYSKEGHAIYIEDNAANINEIKHHLIANALAAMYSHNNNELPEITDMDSLIKVQSYMDNLGADIMGSGKENYARAMIQSDYLPEMLSPQLAGMNASEILQNYVTMGPQPGTLLGRIKEMGVDYEAVMSNIIAIEQAKEAAISGIEVGDSDTPEHGVQHQPGSPASQVSR